MSQSEKRPFFTVVIPVYNKEEHIARCLESVIAQTFQDYEIVMVCDPSTDNSNQAVNRYRGEKVRIFHRDQPGPGGYAARNLGIEKARGEWIAFLDADDEWTAEHLAVVHDLANRHPLAWVIGSGWQNTGATKATADKYYRNFNQLGPHEVSLERYLRQGLHGKRPIHTSVACVRRDSPVLKELFITHPEVKRGGDLFAWLKLMCLHKSLIWSGQIGARYFTDAANMVTKSAPSNGFLMNSQHLKELSTGLSLRERQLLKKYFNRWLRNDWKSNIHRGVDNFNLRQKLYWQGDFLNALIIYITTVWPQRVRRQFGFSGRKH